MNAIMLSIYFVELIAIAIPFYALSIAIIDTLKKITGAK